MTAAEIVARRLAARFLEEGSFTAASSMRGTELEPGIAPAATDRLDLQPLFSQAGFAGLAVQAVGFGEGADDPKVHVYVQKGGRGAVEAIPTSQGEVTIEVNRIGKLLVRPEQASSATNRGRLYTRGQRIACGSSCAPSGESYSGTFGAIVRKSSRNELFILSNNHVLAACNHTPVGMPILAPSNVDGTPTGRAPGEIARHAEICELRSGEPTLVPPCQEDVALARALPEMISSWQGDEQAGYDTPRTIRAPRAGLRVKKFGRTTGLTLGHVEARMPSFTPIPYKAKYFQATVWFHEVWSARGERGIPFALPGDSGSLVVTEDATAAVGLVFAACAYDYALILPMNHVATCFGGIRLVEKHGVEP
jgi:hypothetical protein